MKNILALIIAIIIILPNQFIALNEHLKRSSASDENKLTIDLEKKSYTKYEPIIVKITLINESEVIDTVSDGVFDEYQDDCKFILINENDQEVKRLNLSPLVFRSDVLIMPGDTLLYGMILTKMYGHFLSDKDQYFDYSPCFLDVGKYTLSLECSTINSNFKKYFSNSVSFEVSNLTDEDNQILELIKNKQNQEVMKKYPKNNFCEHAIAAYTLDTYKIDSLDQPQIDKSQIINLYKTFFDTYSDSYYDFDIGFVMSYFQKLVKNTRSNTEVFDEYEKCVSRYNTDGLGSFLKNRNNINTFFLSFQSFRDAIKNYKKN